MQDWGGNYLNWPRVEHGHGGAFPWAEWNFFPHVGGCSGSTPFPQMVTPATVSGKSMKIAYVAVYNR